MPTAPTVYRGIYYWPELSDVQDYAKSVGVTVHVRDKGWPRAIPYTRGWAIQLRVSGPYLGPKHVAVRPK